MAEGPRGAPEGENGPCKVSFRAVTSATEPAVAPVVPGRHGAPELVQGTQAFAALLDELLGAPRYALDTEFHRERTYWPHLELVQLAWEPPSGEPLRVALVDAQAVDLAPLAKVLQGPGVMVAHAASQDLEVLWRACGALPSRLFDTQVAAGFVGHGSASLGSLASAYLEVHLAKGDRLSDWSKRPLSRSQLAYAASDVAYLFSLADAICQELERRGRLDWALQECAVLTERPPLPPEPEEAWWKLRENKALQGGSRGVAQEVAAWRERKAMELDVLPRSLLPDLAVLSIAHSPPASVSALREVRGLDSRHLRGGADQEIFAAVQRGRTLAPERVRSPRGDQLAKQLRPAVVLASAFVAQLSRDYSIDAALLATRADLVEWLSGRDGARLGHGWRAELVGSPLRRLVGGEASLALDGEGNLVIEPRQPTEGRRAH